MGRRLPHFEASEFHKHYHEDECVFVLEGVAETRIGEVVYRVKPSDFLGYRAGGEAHALKNVGDSVFKCIVVGQRRDHDVCDYPILNKRLFRQKNMSWNLVDIRNIVEPVGGRKI